jgi:hypothetical protein
VRYLVRDIKDLNHIIANIAGSENGWGDPLLQGLVDFKHKLQDQLFNVQVEAKIDANVKIMVKSMDDYVNGKSNRVGIG